MMGGAGITSALAGVPAAVDALPFDFALGFLETVATVAVGATMAGVVADGATAGGLAASATDATVAENATHNSARDRIGWEVE